MKYIDLGEFDFTTGKIDATDPCYDKDICCRSVVEAPKGKYIGQVAYDEREHRVCSIAIATKASGYNNPARSFHCRQALGINFKEISCLGVDAGLCGFFQNKPDYSNEEWLNLCNNVFIDKDYGMLDCGFWSSSGYGDGGYPLYEHRDKNGDIDMLVINFIEFEE